MKRNLFKVLCICLFFIGCKKTEITEPALNNNEPGTTDGFGNRQCRLTQIFYSEEYIQTFHYNNRGLADQWNIDYGDGLPDNFTFTYDNHGRLKTGHVVFNFTGHEYDIRFQYWGDKLLREVWYEPGTTNIIVNILNTYNSRGQVIKRADQASNNYCTFTYDFLGNSPLSKYYVDGELFYQGDYTFYRPNRNPWLSINGIDIGIPYLTLNFTPWWETSEKLTLYDAGVPEVIEDFDPFQTVMHLGPQFYLTSITNYDRITDEHVTTYFDYENCGSHNNYTDAGIPAIKNSKRSSEINSQIRKVLNRFLITKKADLKKEIKQLKALIE